MYQDNMSMEEERCEEMTPITELELLGNESEEEPSSIMSVITKFEMAPQTGRSAAAQGNFPCITRCIQSTILLDTSRVAAASWGQTCADCKSKGCISGDTTTVCWYSSSVQAARAS